MNNSGKHRHTQLDTDYLAESVSWYSRRRS